MLAVALAWNTSGCTHFHNQTNEDLAKTALQDFNDFKKVSGGPYLSMLRNHSKMDAASIAFQAEVAKVKTATIAAGLSQKKWGDIKTALETERSTRQTRLGDVVRDLERLTGLKATTEPEIERLKKALQVANDKLKAAYGEQDKWEARQVLFLSAIKISAELAASRDTPDAATLRKLREEALQQKVTLERFDDAGNPKTETKTVADILDSEASKILDGKGAILTGNISERIGDYTYNLFDPDSAPGLKVLIFSLGVDLATQQLERTKLEAAYLRDRIAAAREQQRLLDNADSIDAATAIQILVDRSAELPSDGVVLTTLNELRPQRDKAKALQDAFEVLGTLAFFQTVDESRWQESTTRAEFLNHQRSIKLSAINALEHEALIGRGLQALLVYHQGGLTEERIANFIRLAQTAALAVIGVGVQ
jgi:hypothetical protein